MRSKEVAAVISKPDLAPGMHSLFFPFVRQRLLQVGTGLVGGKHLPEEEAERRVTNQTNRLASALFTQFWLYSISEKSRF